MRLRIETHDRQLAGDLLGLPGEPATLSRTQIPDGPSLEYEYRVIRFSTGVPDVLDFVLGMALGGAISATASWLAERLSGRAVTVHIDGVSVKVTEEDIARAIADRVAELVGGDDVEQALGKLRKHDLFLRLLDERVGSNPREVIRCNELGAELGFSLEEVARAVAYWESRDCVRLPYAAFGDPAQVMLTAKGAEKVLESGATAESNAVQPSAAPIAGTTSDANLPGPEAEEAVFRKKGEFWLLKYESEDTYLSDIKGMAYLAFLLRNEGRQYAALQLLQAVDGVSGLAKVSDSAQDRVTDEEGVENSWLPDAGPVADGPTIDAVRGRLDELEEMEREAKERNPLDSLEEICEERDALLAYLSEALGIGGRPRRGASHYSRVRLRVYQNISRALKKIESTHPSLHLHLTNSIHTTPLFAYRPDRTVGWSC